MIIVGIFKPQPIVSTTNKCVAAFDRSENQVLLHNQIHLADLTSYANSTEKLNIFYRYFPNIMAEMNPDQPRPLHAGKISNIPLKPTHNSFIN